MEKNQIKWNERYRTDPHSKSPSPILKRFCPMAPAGRALDIACGTGGNAVFLKEQGFEVDAVDISDVALAAISEKHPDIRTIHADLDTYDIPPNRYSLIVNARFLNRRLFPYIKEALVPGGMLIFETYVEAPEFEAQAISCRDYLLRDNELLHAFISLYIIHYEEKTAPTPKGMGRMASLVGIKHATIQRSPLLK